MRKFRLLNADEIEVKIKQVTEKGAVALIYKTSRVDMDILDETVGAENWQSEYSEIHDNLYCGIGIRDETTQEWVWKYDCGVESREDSGNEKKGEASDAFKRAGVQWGIGRELYTAPFIFLSVETVAVTGRGYKLKNPFARFDVKEITYDKANRIAQMVIADDKGNEVYRYPKEAASAAQKPKQTAKKEEFKPITKTELVQVYGVKNPEATIAALEDKFETKFKDWNEDTTLAVRIILDKKKQEREAAKTEAGEYPFSMTD